MRIAQLPRTEIYEIYQNTKCGSLDATHDGELLLAFPFFLLGRAPLVYHDTTPCCTYALRFFFTFMAAGAFGIGVDGCFTGVRVGR